MLLEVVLKQRPTGVTFSAEDTRAHFARWYWRLLLWGVVRNGGNEWTLVAGNNVVGGRLVSGGFARARRPLEDCGRGHDGRSGRPVFQAEVAGGPCDLGSKGFNPLDDRGGSGSWELSCENGVGILGICVSACCSGQARIRMHRQPIASTVAILRHLLCEAQRNPQPYGVAVKDCSLRRIVRLLA